jgi:hypothetical protein
LTYRNIIAKRSNIIFSVAFIFREAMGNGEKILTINQEREKSI